MSLKKKFLEKLFNKVDKKETNISEEKYNLNSNNEIKTRKVEPPRVVNRYEYNFNDDNFSAQNSYLPSEDFNKSLPYNSNLNNQYNNSYNTPYSKYNPQNQWQDNSNTEYFNESSPYLSGDYQHPEQLSINPINENYNSNDYYIPSHQQESITSSLNISNQHSHNYRPLSIKVLPKEISNEVKSEKYRLILTMITGLLGFIMTIIPLILWFLKEQNLVIDDDNIIPHPALMTPLCIISLGLFFVSLFDRIRIKREVETYLKNIQLGNNNIIPNFIIYNYKKMHVRSIIINWIAFPSYILGAFIIALLYGLSEASNPKIGFITLEVSIRNLSTEIIILTIILFAIFFLQVLNIILVRKRKANILGFYGYEIVNPYEMNELKRKINRRCLWVWLIIIAIIGIVITIPILIIRRKKNK